MINEIGIVAGIFLGVIIGMLVDYLLFRWWHGNAHSKKLRAEENKQKYKEDQEWENN